MNFYYEELRNIHQAISKLNLEEQEKKEKEALLLDTLTQIIKFSKLTRNKGLLALEEAATEITSTSSCEGFFKHLLCLVVEATDPDEILQIAFSRYYSSLVTDYDALIYLIYLKGALAIQQGENPRLIMEKLKAMLPNELFYTCDETLEKHLSIR